MLEIQKEEHLGAFLFRKSMVLGDRWNGYNQINIFDYRLKVFRVFPLTHKKRFPSFESNKSLQEVFYEHTIWPLIKETESVELNENLVARFNSDKMNDYISTTLSKGKNVGYESFYCSDCMRESVSDRGYAYYKRIWTIPLIDTCAKHKKKMQNTKALNCNCCKIGKPDWMESILLGACVKCGKNTWGKQTQIAYDVDVSLATWIEAVLKSRVRSFNREQKVWLIKEAAYSSGLDPESSESIQKHFFDKIKEERPALLEDLTGSRGYVLARILEGKIPLYFESILFWIILHSGFKQFSIFEECLPDLPEASYC
ncbi:hypothetical protein EOPP23_00080 [Endozoicomonas sp. OPT23]|uniref:hypothetical protein n=1 Tax=Endozoicomonas sp. OPT23 TaxID=2072845 RepID=UPI00129BBDAE|nr:hypothetical protein [Endozoicomonas sp. OPT23]MRI31385.1 hypothetical protein [Endozoicomonas sp. OPT23]